MSNLRRQFMGRLLVVGAAVSASTAGAQAGAHVDEADEQAVTLAYRHDTTKVAAAAFATHTAAQRCSNCSFWQGKPEDAWAGCAMFGRKHVANAGWCKVWAKAPG